LFRFLIFTGFLIVIIGLLLHFKVEIPWLTSWIGKLPGDLVIKKGNATIYLPVATSLVASALVSFVLWALFGSKKG
jgi:hypothetical protein